MDIIRLRMQCLEIAQTTSRDEEEVIRKARAFEAYVMEDTQKDQVKPPKSSKKTKKKTVDNSILD